MDLENVIKRGGSPVERKMQASKSRGLGEKVQNSEAKLEEGVQFAKLKISELIENPYQPRMSIDKDSLLQLATTIKNNNNEVLQPIKVAITEDGKKYIIMGHRRVLACKMLNLEYVASTVKYNATEMDLRIMSIVENLEREDMHKIEYAISFNSCMQSGLFKNQAELASKLGREKTFVSKVIKLLSLPQNVIDDLVKNKSTNDIVALDMIRKITDQKECEEIYFWFIKEKPGREELKKRIASGGTVKESEPRKLLRRWGSAKKTKEVYDLRILRKELSKKVDDEIKSKIKEIQELLDKELSTPEEKENAGYEDEYKKFYK